MKRGLVMQNVCPITDKRINEQVARLNALFTVLLVSLFIAFKFWPGLAFLLVDFLLRGFVDSKYSPIAAASKWVTKQMKLSPKMINAGPKIFAAQVGSFLSSVILVAYAFGCHSACLGIAFILGVFSFLESAFGICVACKLYPIIRRK